MVRLMINVIKYNALFNRDLGQKIRISTSQWSQDNAQKTVPYIIMLTENVQQLHYGEKHLMPDSKI